MSRSSRQEIDELAARWVARMDSGRWTDADDVELGSWSALDPRHAGALLHAQALWSAIDSEPLSEEHFSECAPEGANSKPPLWNRRWLLGSAGVALAASFVGALMLDGFGTSYATAVGEIRRVPLADGSTAAINTDSEIAVAIAGSQRSVTLERGEAWFQVAKDPKRPFIVEAGNVLVQAVGTAFSVRRRQGGADVIVTEGVVEAWAKGADGQKVKVTAGNMAFIADNAAVERTMAADDAPNAERALAWRAGKIDLAGTRVEDAIADFNRYNARQIILLDQALASERIDGVFRTDDPLGFARSIAASFEVGLDTSNPKEIRISVR